MAQRPNLLDLRSNSNMSASSAGSRPLRSPRLHVAGEAPPELSPLDAFAMQSRLLAKQLQESQKDGNRLSRLPPLTVESPLVVQGRSDYFRSFACESGSEDGELPELQHTGLGLQTEYRDDFENNEAERPRSMHPRMSTIPPTPDESVPALPPARPEFSRGRKLQKVEDDPEFFDARQERSPSPLQSDAQSPHDFRRDYSAVRKDYSLPIAASRPESYAHSPEKYKQSSLDDMGLAPPRPMFPQRKSSIGSSTPGEDDASSIHMGSSFHSLPPRKLSSGSAAFGNALASPALGHFARSPSIASDISPLPRPSFNFSRPLSRAGTPTFEPPSRNFGSPSRQASSDSQPSFVLADETVHTPVSMHGESFTDYVEDGQTGAAPSYIYSKFSLPRGKSIQRGGSSDDNSQAAGQGDPRSANNGQRQYMGAPPSPPSRPVSSSGRPLADDAVSMLSRPSMEAGKASMDSTRFGPYGRPSQDSGRPSEDNQRGRTRTSPAHVSRGRTPTSHAPSTSTSDSASTIRPPPTRSGVQGISDMSAEDHLNKGIECHENGSLTKSTYHLRLAARQHNPTAMLLYALACRHGWGMRANQREGVEWLRKAAEFASIEIADDEDQAKEGKRVDFLESKTRKAQFALSIYELGVSHMNGWGIEQDKGLALRCFEIAGTWGDVDALAEAGFCYAQGIGAKKNLKKSAKFYRMAEAKGMSMVGNSWIHKAKYNEDEPASPKKDKKKARSKSRTRTMFSKKA